MKKKLLSVFYIVNLVIVVLFWWNNSAYLFGLGLSQIFVALGRLTGLLAALFVVMQFLLIGRVAWLEHIFGHDRLARFHHRTGRWSYLFIILHPIFITVGYAGNAEVSVGKQFWEMVLTYPYVGQAAIATILFTCVVGTSIYIVRKRMKYESWYYVHLLTYLAVVLSWGHQLVMGDDFLAQPLFTSYWYVLYIFVFGNFFWYRLFKPLYISRKHDFFVEKIVEETYDTWSVYVSGKDMSLFLFEPGQFVIVRFFAKGYGMQSHPFSLSQAYNGKNLRLSIKKVGDYTAQIKDIPLGTKVLVEGPLGVFTKKSMVNEKALFIAGGIGITPIRSLIEEMYIKGTDIVLIFGNKSEQDIVFKNEFESFQKIVSFPIHHVLSNTTNAAFLNGFVDKQKISDLVKDLTQRDVFLCGPPVMMDKLIPVLREMGVSQEALHFEKFSL